MKKYIVYDSETTGLGIRTDKPFMFQYAVVDEKLLMVGDVQVIYVSDTKAMQKFEQLLRTIPTHIGANIKFEMHMCLNIGMDPEIFEDKNFIDVAVLARLVLNHDMQRDKSFSTALKKMAVRFLNIDSADEETKLKAELSALTIIHKNKLYDYLSTYGVWKKEWKGGEKTKHLNRIYNHWFKYFHLYPEIQPYRKKFFEAVPAPTYADVSNIDIYAATDTLLTYKLFYKWYPLVKQKDQIPTLIRVSRATWPLVLTERQGMSVNVYKLLADRKRIVAEMDSIHIIDPRTGVEYSVGQHAKLKKLYEYETGLMLDNADKFTRERIMKDSPSAQKAQRLSDMAKYLNSYMTRILKKTVQIDGEFKVFTQYNMAGTVTGRLSSDFQQFPRDPLILEDGYEINIRDWFTVPKTHKYMFYFDYSQMELRLQCEWTNMVNGYPDPNMIRAFQPKGYYHYQTGELFQEHDPNELQPSAPIDMDIEDALKAGWSAWVDENNQPWIPTDLHASTAKHAFPNIDESHPDWKHYRSLGKRTNFAVNYGASAAKVASAIGQPLSVGKALVAGYQKTFKGIIDFSNFLYKATRIKPRIPNLLGRYYYTRNKHLLQNWLVQGSGADILLEAMYAVWQYIKDKPWWQFMINVHDEIGFTCDDIPEEQIDREAKEIQAIMTYRMQAVDITVDIEYTTTTWARKKAWKGHVL